METVTSQRAPKVLYDQSNSTVIDVNLDDFDWDEIFDGAQWLHWTDITPELCKETQVVLIAALKETSILL